MLAYPNIDPVAVDFGIIKIRWYGVSYVAGILTAWWLLTLRAGRIDSGWQSEEVADLIFYGTVGLLIGGRLGSVIFYNAGYYAAHPLAVFKIWEGGMSFHGAVLGVVIALIMFARGSGREFFQVSDFLIPVIPVGLFSGRLGNFVNGELWGTPSNLPWAMVFPDPRSGGIPRHPSQLYEALLEGVILFLVLWWYSARPQPRMAVSGLFLLLYGVLRGTVEFVRAPDPHIGYLASGWLTMGQVLSLPMAIAGIALLYLSRRRSPS